MMGEENDVRRCDVNEVVSLWPNIIIGCTQDNRPIPSPGRCEQDNHREQGDIP